jgi:hypothetical protein
LIDVRDIEEVGAGPLMEELGFEEPKATEVVTRCAEEAKIVAGEQEAKKATEASAKAKDRAALAASGGRDGSGDSAAARAFADALQIPQSKDAPVEEPAADFAEGSNGSGTMPGPMEAAEGGAPETVTHAATAFASADELSPEEEAIQGIGESPDPNHKELPDENEEAAALAEGRLAPPEEQA